MRRPFAAAAALLCALALAVPAVGAGGPGNGIAVGAAPVTIATELGREFTFKTTITNTESRPTASVLVHLNVLSLRSDVYVDPEDWSVKRTRYLGVLPAGASRTIVWQLKAVNPGRFAAFASVLPQAGSTDVPANGPTVSIAVAERQTLNSGGILPLAIGVPMLLALLTVGVQLRRGRR